MSKSVVPAKPPRARHRGVPVGESRPSEVGGTGALTTQSSIVPASSSGDYILLSTMFTGTADSLQMKPNLSVTQCFDAQNEAPGPGDLETSSRTDGVKPPLSPKPRKKQGSEVVALRRHDNAVRNSTASVPTDVLKLSQDKPGDINCRNSYTGSNDTRFHLHSDDRAVVIGGRLSTFTLVESQPVLYRSNDGKNGHHQKERSLKSVDDALATIPRKNDTIAVINNNTLIVDNGCHTSGSKSLPRNSSLQSPSRSEYQKQKKQAHIKTVSSSQSLDRRLLSSKDHKRTDGNGYKKMFNKVQRHEPSSHSGKTKFLCHDCLSAEDDVNDRNPPLDAPDCYINKGIMDSNDCVPQPSREQLGLREMMFKELIAKAQRTRLQQHKRNSIIDGHVNHLSSINEIEACYTDERSDPSAPSTLDQFSRRGSVKPKVPVRSSSIVIESQTMSINSRIEDAVSPSVPLSSISNAPDLQSENGVLKQPVRKTSSLGPGVRNSSFMTHDEALHILEEKPLGFFNYPSVEADTISSPMTPGLDIGICTSPGDVFELGTSPSAQSHSTTVGFVESPSIKSRYFSSEIAKGLKKKISQLAIPALSSDIFSDEATSYQFLQQQCPSPSSSYKSNSSLPNSPVATPAEVVGA